MTDLTREYKIASLRSRSVANKVAGHPALKIDREPTIQNLATIRTAHRMLNEVKAFLDKEHMTDTITEDE